MTKPVLYVEDEEDDAFLMKLALERNRITLPLKVVTDGRQAIDYVAGNGRFADREENPLPCLMLLDLNLPVVSGLEVLKWVREESNCNELPIIIFSSSSHPDDMRRARDLGADDYLVKPVDLGRMDEMLRDLYERWLKHHCTAVPT
jgi:CheY-like chemotaxis protein